MKDFTIGEAARRAGVAASALRYYEDAGIIPRARRVNGQRRYDETLVGIIRVARFAQSVGFSLAEVKSLFREAGDKAKVGAQWRSLAAAKVRELDAIISRARHMKSAIEAGLECGCIRADDCLPKSRARRQPRSGDSE